MIYFEDNLKNSIEPISYMPDSLIIKYFSGNGKSVTLKA
jgi:hypothetical protein